MNQEINVAPMAQETLSEVRLSDRADTGGKQSGHENPKPGFNRYIYENMLCHIEGQIECWNRRAVREPNPEAAQALWLKAEGLGYAIRLLYAFEPEFRELVECATLADTNGKR